MYVCMYVYIHMYVCMHVQVQWCTYIHNYIFMCVHLFAPVCVDIKGTTIHPPKPVPTARVNVFWAVLRS